VRGNVWFSTNTSGCGDELLENEEEMEVFIYYKPLFGSKVKYAFTF
jgi:hypothetical protein